MKLILFVPVYIYLNLFIVFDWLYVSYELSSSGYNLYYTDRRANSLDRDCLYYSVPQKGLNFQLIPYCIRFHLEDNHSNMTNLNYNLFTFDDLRQKNITSFQLFKWSAPIDIVERYQMFLDNASYFGLPLFYNCTHPWFGSFCEYYFENAQHSFSQQVSMNFAKDYPLDEVSKHIPCYMHIQCDRAGDHGRTSGACLDWREVCDGKMDCVDGGFDEEHCWQLEANECDQKTEFRCHNGLCIPIAFLNDDLYNPDCLDRTDEHRVKDTPTMVEQQSYFFDCFPDPSSRCEDHLCRPLPGRHYIHSCGDGNCVNPFIMFCSNGRSNTLIEAWISNLNVSKDCRMAFYCFSSILIANFAFHRNCEYDDRREYAMLLKQHCPPLITLSNILLGHVSLVYTNDQIEKVDRLVSHYTSLPPDYICYDSKLCHNPMFPYVNHPPVDLFQNNSTCQPFLEFEKSRFWSSHWSSSMNVLYGLFHTCSNYHQVTSVSNHSGLYACRNSSKVISQDRLCDQVQDCFFNDDETFSNSCSLNTIKHRFECKVGNQTFCIARIRLYDGLGDYCDALNETLLVQEEHKTRISFQTMCDGFTELNPISIDGRNQTDETECYQFECNNIYTRCDGYWNCPDGVDEINCEWPPLCPSQHHLCLSPVTNNVTCLSITYINDGKADCFGYADERDFCRKSSTIGHYKCWKHNQCIKPTFVCPPVPWVCGGDDISASLCNNISMGAVPLCWNHKNPNYVQQALCNLDAYSKPKKRYFSLFGNTSYVWTQRFATAPSSSVMPAVNSRQNNENIRATQENIRRCNRGVEVQRLLQNTNHSQMLCLCPPAYYGEFCHFQNQRVSLIVQIIVPFEWRIAFTILISLHDDRQGLIESHDQIQYLSARDCNKKFNIYLLYKSRPKTSSTNHSIHFDVYNKYSLEHRGSWSFPIQLPFLPVHRPAYQLQIPSEKSVSQRCSDRQCGTHGYCSHYINNNDSFCICENGWSGAHCELQDQCGCAHDSVCLYSQACLCRLSKFGPRCYGKYETCLCRNGGTCVYNDERSNDQKEYFCICAAGFRGPSCEIKNTRIEVSFIGTVSIPLFILTHFIQTFDSYTPPVRQTVFTKVRLDEDYAIVHIENPFNLVFVEIEPKIYYLSHFQRNYTETSSLSWKISPSSRCLAVSELFNNSFAEMPLIRRMKYYYDPCKNRTDLPCFYDEKNICICDPERHQTNCFEFDHNVTYDCAQRTICQNNGRCFTDYPNCPTTFTCACSECTYGSRCQFLRSKLDLSLDSILGYQIQRQKSFTQQRASVKVTVGIVTIILVCGIISNVLSILTFQTKKSKAAGSGYLLLTSSCASLCLIIIFTMKTIFTVMTHMSVLTNRNFLSFNCIVSDFLMKVLLYYVSWLNALVAVERSITVIQEASFNQNTAITVAKRMIVVVLVLVVVTNLQDPIRRRLIDDKDENRLWCVVEHSQSLRTFNFVMLLVHFLGPFVVNTISAAIIICKVARRKATLVKRHSYTHHLVQQLNQFKHQLISPVILSMLELPSVIISFSSDCMKSSRSPWLVLAGLYTSFVPPTLILVIYVLPSVTYKQELLTKLKSIRSKIFRL